MKITWLEIRWSRCGRSMAAIYAALCMILGSSISTAQEPTAQEPLTLNGHTKRVYSVTFSPQRR